MKSWDDGEEPDRDKFPIPDDGETHKDRQKAMRDFENDSRMEEDRKFDAPQYPDEIEEAYEGSETAEEQHSS